MFKNPLVKRSLHLIKHHWRVLLIVFLCLMLEAAMNVAIPEGFGALVDHAFPSRGSETDEMRENILGAVEKALPDTDKSATAPRDAIVGAVTKALPPKENPTAARREEIVGAVKQALPEENKSLDAPREEILGAVEEAMPVEENSNGNLAMIEWVLGGLGVGALVIAVTAMWREHLFSHIVCDFLHDLRLEMFKHLQNLSMSFYSRFEMGDILARFSSDLGVVERGVNEVVPWVIAPGLDVLVNTVALFLLNWRMALLSLLIWPVMFIGPRYFAPKVAAASNERKELEGHTMTEVQENVGAQPVVKAFGLSEFATKKFSHSSHELAHSIVHLRFFGGMVERSSVTGALLLQVALLALGSYMVWKGPLTVGDLAAFQALFLSITISLGYVAAWLPTVMDAAAGARRIEDILGEEPEVRNAPAARECPKLNQSLGFHDVSFGYTEKGLDVKHATIEIPRGTSVAFVGGSGSGKSTLLTLLARFYDPSEGKVTIDGVDLRDVTMESYRAQMGVVFQESFLFNTSIKENIRYGRIKATDEDIVAAAKLAEIHDVIVAMPDGYETVAGVRGGKISGGQRQRIALARAMIRDPKILLLDEATSALDPGTEAAVNATLKRVAPGRTTISVTHRLTTVMDSDKIVVLVKGTVAEQGSHQELLALGGVYKALWQKQSGFQISADGEDAKVSVERLRALPIFAKLDDVSLKEAADNFVSEQVPAGRLVVQEGDPGDLLYIVVRGSVEVSKIGADGVSRRVAVLQDGDHFGEVALLQPVPRTATVKTIDPCVFLTLKRIHFASLLKRAPEMRADLERIFLQRLSAEGKPQEKPTNTGAGYSNVPWAVTKPPEK
jgi:ATP-binding cassette subfamily B protein